MRPAGRTVQSIDGRCTITSGYSAPKASHAAAAAAPARAPRAPRVLGPGGPRARARRCARTAVPVAGSRTSRAACIPYSLWLGVFVQDLRLPARVTGAGIAAAVAPEIGVAPLFAWSAAADLAIALAVLALLALRAGGRGAEQR